MKKTILLSLLLVNTNIVQASSFYLGHARIDTVTKTACYKGSKGINILGREDIACVKLTDNEVNEALKKYQQENQKSEEALNKINPNITLFMGQVLLFTQLFANYTLLFIIHALKFSVAYWWIWVLLFIGAAMCSACAGIKEGEEK
jgi:hypothetical protein